MFLALSLFVQASFDTVAQTLSVQTAEEETSAVEEESEAEPAEDLIEDPEVEPLIVGEVTEKREESRKVFRLEDGSFLSAEYPVPVHYQNEAGEWVDYDNTLTRVTVGSSSGETQILQQEEETAGFSLAEEESAALDAAQGSALDASLEEENMGEEPLNPNAVIPLVEYKADGREYPVTLAENMVPGRTVTLENGEYPLSWGPVGAQASSIEVTEETEEFSGNDRFLVLRNLTQQAWYRSVYPNVDVQYVISSTGIKENFVLNASTAPASFVT